MEKSREWSEQRGSPRFCRRTFAGNRLGDGSDETFDSDNLATRTWPVCLE